MKKQQASVMLPILLGALLTGFSWRVRGSGGWGAAWGLLNAGMLMTLFLSAARGRKDGASLPLIALAAFSFMFTAPAWGTLLTQITGVMTVDYASGQQTVFVSPVSGVLLMLCMGFGLAALYGVMLGRVFSGKAWRLRDYAAVLVVFLIVSYGAKASVAHLLVKVVQPQAVEAFRTGLSEVGIDKPPFTAYMTHFNAESWAKKVAGGRHYYACISAFSSALGSLAAILSARFLVKDKYASKIGLTVCGAFAFAITLSDLFFWFGNGGYHMQNGSVLPNGWAAWSLWEYFTGFIAGGIITSVILNTAPDMPVSEPLLDNLPEKTRRIVDYILCWIGLIGINAVRPLQRRLDDNTALMIMGITVGVLAVLTISLFLCRKYGPAFEKIPMPLLSPALCGAFVLYDTLVYLFVSTDEPAVRSLTDLHNILTLASCAAVSVWCCYTVTARKRGNVVS